MNQSIIRRLKALESRTNDLSDWTDQELVDRIAELVRLHPEYAGMGVDQLMAEAARLEALSSEGADRAHVF